MEDKQNHPKIGLYRPVFFKQKLQTYERLQFRSRLRLRLFILLPLQLKPARFASYVRRRQEVSPIRFEASR